MEGSGPKPAEIELYEAITLYGVWGVYGRPLTVLETRCLTAAYKTYRFYMTRANWRDKKGNQNFADFADKRPDENNYLEGALKAARKWNPEPDA